MKRGRSEHLATGRLCAYLAFFIPMVLVLSCASPAGIAQFSETAQEVLVQSPLVFRDIPESCIRRHAAAAPISPIFMPAKNIGDAKPPNDNPVCVPFVSQTEGLVQASDVLSSYFRAMQQLASFNTSAVSSISEKAGENAGFAAKFDLAQADSVGKLAGLVTQLVTERYQRSKLLQLLREADPEVASVTQALQDVVSKDYTGFLHEEQQSVTAKYQNVGDTGNLAVTMLLNRAYTDDLNALNRRKLMADNYVRALQQIREGHRQLALNLPHLKAKEITMALEPYTARLKGIVPTLTNGF